MGSEMCIRDRACPRTRAASRRPIDGDYPRIPPRCLLCCDLIADAPPGVNLDNEDLDEWTPPFRLGRFVHHAPCFAIHKLIEHSRAPGKRTYERAPFCPTRALEKLTEVTEPGSYKRVLCPRVPSPYRILQESGSYQALVSASLYKPLLPRASLQLGACSQ